MDIQLELDKILERIKKDEIDEEELTKMLEESKSENKLIYYLLTLPKYFPLNEFNFSLENNENNKLILTIGANYDITNEELDFEDYHCLYLMIEPIKIYI